MLFRFSQRITGAVMALLAAAIALPVGAEDGLVAAASEDRLWLVRPALPDGRDADRPRLLHHALEMEGPFFSRGPTLSRLPEAAAASGDRVWLATSSQQAGDELHREVFTVSMQREPAMGLYQSVPRDRLALAEALPGWGRLAGFAAGSAGPVALIVPLQHETIDVRREGRETSAYAIRSPQLLQMRGSRWEPIELPADFSAGRNGTMHLAFDGHGQRRLNLLVQGDGTTPGMFYRRYLGDDGQWEAIPVEFDPRRIRSLTSVGERLVAVSAENDGTIHFSYVRRGHLLTLTQIDRPTGRWVVAGLRDGLRLVTIDREGSLMMQHIDAITGASGEALEMSDQPLPAGKLWHTGLMLTVSVLAVLIVLLVRPGSRGEVRLPKHTAVLPGVPRLFALLIDLVPGAVLATLILRVPPIDLLRLPLLAETLDQAAAHLLMLGFTFAHCTVVELLTGTTLGKMLIGAGVASADGSRPTVGQVLIRNGVKLMVLIVPPLAVFALLNPYMQGFNDMAARTVVLREIDEEPAGQEK